MSATRHRKIVDVFSFFYLHPGLIHEAINFVASNKNNINLQTWCQLHFYVLFRFDRSRKGTEDWAKEEGVLAVKKGEKRKKNTTHINKFHFGRFHACYTAILFLCMALYVYTDKSTLYIAINVKEILRAEFDYNTLIQYRSMHRIYALKYVGAPRLKLLINFQNMKKNPWVYAAAGVVRLAPAVPSVFSPQLLLSSTTVACAWCYRLFYTI